MCMKRVQDADVGCVHSREQVLVIVLAVRFHPHHPSRVLLHSVRCTRCVCLHYICTHRHPPHHHIIFEAHPGSTKHTLPLKSQYSLVVACISPPHTFCCAGFFAAKRLTRVDTSAACTLRRGSTAVSRALLHVIASRTGAPRGAEVAAPLLVGAVAARLAAAVVAKPGVVVLLLLLTANAESSVDIHEEGRGSVVWAKSTGCGCSASSAGVDHASHAAVFTGVLSVVVVSLLRGVTVSGAAPVASCLRPSMRPLRVGNCGRLMAPPKYEPGEGRRKVYVWGVWGCACVWNMCMWKYVKSPGECVYPLFTSTVHTDTHTQHSHYQPLLQHTWFSNCRFGRWCACRPFCYTAAASGLGWEFQRCAALLCFALLNFLADLCHAPCAKVVAVG